MKVIGAGLPRTATLTQKIALEMLGFGPCYHMVNVFMDFDQVGLWRDALDGRPDWQRIFGDCQATVDWPSGFFYRELLEAHPDAKVLLSVREPESWEKSMRDTVWGVIHGDILIRHISSAAGMVDRRWGDYLELMKALLWEGRGTLAENHHEPGALVKGYHRHTEAVKESVPAEQLLTWHPKDGWEPLCEFLEVEVPSTPLPHVNDSATFGERVIEMCLGMVNDWWKQERAAAEATPSGAQPVG
jgi:hypothetical protein